jgi:hypothetical protein
MREGLKFCTTERAVLRALRNMTEKYGGRIPYAMIQPRLLNRLVCCMLYLTMTTHKTHCRKEFKVVVLNGSATHVLPQCSNGVSCSSSTFKVVPTTEALFNFAEFAVHCLSKGCPGSLVDGLIRVDIMETKSGNWIVNEFESLEAIYTIPDRGHVATSDIDYFLTQYWTKVAKSKVEQWISAF